MFPFFSFFKFNTYISALSIILTLGQLLLDIFLLCAVMLIESLESVIRKIPSEQAVMFSGGLDSGVLAAISKKYFTPILYTVGVENSHDLSAGEQGAQEVGLPWMGITLTDELIIEECCKVLKLADLSPLELSFELPLQIIASRIEEENIISGQGADELFGGYSRYSEMSADEAESSMKKDYESLFTNTVIKENLIASAYQKTLWRPFLDAQVAEIALSIPISEKISQGVNKIPLRNLAAELGLNVISMRGKKAAQYGSGIMKSLKSSAKRSNLTLNEYITLLKKENI